MGCLRLLPLIIRPQECYPWCASPEVAPASYAPFPIGRNERSMPGDAGVKFPDDFLKRIDAGLIDKDFVRELGSLTPEQREELASLLIERAARRVRLN